MRLGLLHPQATGVLENVKQACQQEKRRQTHPHARPSKIVGAGRVSVAMSQFLILERVRTPTAPSSDSFLHVQNDIRHVAGS
eukprot:scaffold1461_cov253-Pinguiococcus_pyrenoidosus.AAC.24